MHISLTLGDCATGVVYELLDRMLGLTLPVGGYDYRNVEMDVWRRGIEEQKQADADRAKKLQEGAPVDGNVRG